MLGRIIAVDGATARVVRADLEPGEPTDRNSEGAWMELGPLPGDQLGPGALVYFGSGQRTRQVAALAGSDAAVSKAIATGSWFAVIAKAYNAA